MSSSQNKPCKKGHISGRRKSGNCVQCERERYQNPDRREYVKSKQAQRRAAIKNDPIKNAAHKEYTKQYVKDNRQKLNEDANRRYAERKVIIRLQRKGIKPTPQILGYIENHSGNCDICGGGPDGRWKELSIDHCHNTGIFRGMLCTECNTGIGKFKDNPELIRKAADYVQHYQ